MNRLITLALALLLLGGGLPAQENTAEELKFQLRELQLENQAVKSQLELESKNRQSDMASMRSALDAVKNDVDVVRNNQMLYTSILGFLGIGLGVVALYQVFVNTKKMIQEKIALVVEENRQKIINLIKSQELEHQLRTGSQVLVISPGEEPEGIIRGLLLNLGITASNIRYRRVEEVKNIQELEPDLFILNQLEAADADKLVKDSAPGQYFVAYTKVNLARHERLNFSNSPMTLYSNIINTLKFKKLVKA